MILKLSALGIVAISQCTKKSAKTIANSWILCTKNLFLTT